MLCAVTPMQCLIEAQAYSANAQNEMRYGFLKLNGTVVWQSSWHGNFTNDRGANIFLIEICNCTLRQWRHYDTSSDSSAGPKLSEYLMGQPDETILVGVSVFEASVHLDAAEAALAALGADVSDVDYRGAWVFAAKKGDTSMTVFDKALTEDAAYARQPNISAFFAST